MVEDNGLSELLRRDTETTPLTPPDTWQMLHMADWRNRISECCLKLFRTQDKVILCLTGRAGTGKSTLSRSLRKQGLPGIPAADLLVIDDGVAHLKLFGLISRRVRHKSRGKDYLAPFAPYFKNKKLLVYTNATPEYRVDRCDVLLRLVCDDSTRQQRLLKREADGKHRFEQSTLHQQDLPKILASHYYSMDNTSGQDT